MIANMYSYAAVALCLLFHRAIGSSAPISQIVFSDHSHYTATPASLVPDKATSLDIIPQADPSPDPYGEGPGFHEWLWRDWTVPDTTGRGLRIHDEFPTWLALIGAATKSVYYNDTSFHRWFGILDSGHLAEIGRVYQAMAEFYDDWEGPNATDTIPGATNEATDFNNNACTTKPELVAYIDGPTGRFHICANSMRLPTLTAIHCDAIDA